jgi:hypothetical protein
MVARHTTQELVLDPGAFAPTQAPQRLIVRALALGSCWLRKRRFSACFSTSELKASRGQVDGGVGATPLGAVLVVPTGRRTR